MEKGGKIQAGERDEGGKLLGEGGEEDAGCVGERERETWEHVWESCRRWKKWGGGWSERVGWVLGGKGRGNGE